MIQCALLRTTHYNAVSFHDVNTIPFFIFPKRVPFFMFRSPNLECRTCQWGHMIFHLVDTYDFSQVNSSSEGPGDIVCFIFVTMKIIIEKKKSVHK